MKFKTIRLILGDQLNINHSWFTAKADNSILHVLMEVRTETDYACHHIQKIVGFFAAMRSFAEELVEKKFQVKYFNLNDADNQQDFVLNLKALIDKYAIEKIEIQQPDELRLDLYFQSFARKLQQDGIDFDIYSSEHFLAERNELETMLGKKQRYLMESFYRKMRKKHSILMEGNEPENGKWNFDAENRKKLPKDHYPPQANYCSNDVSVISKMIEDQNLNTIGELGDSKNFTWPINREQSLQTLDYFCSTLLFNFGIYQDAMTEKSDYIYHSRLSFALNTKMLNPLEVIRAAEKAYRKDSKKISFAALEGFVRQILGWREFMRSFYWLKMPKFSEENFFNNKNPLPHFYWTGDTKMSCLKHAINSSLENAYAHHIQRLMVTGNFALLAGVHPDEVDKWYLGIYIDALEWVEITNTRGMSQWADGGGLATKPYISSASYINKMSDYCKACHYNHKEKAGDKACPFNSMYWAFLDKHRAKLAKNPRMTMMYKVFEKMDEDERESILQQAEKYYLQINEL